MRIALLRGRVSAVVASSLITPAAALFTLAAAPLAHAESPRATRIIDVEIDGGRTPITLALSVADESCSEADSTRGDERLHVKICHEGAAALYAFEVRRDNGRAGMQRFDVRAQVVPGGKVVIGRLRQADATVEVAATLHPL